MDAVSEDGKGGELDPCRLQLLDDDAPPLAANTTSWSRTSNELEATTSPVGIFGTIGGNSWPESLSKSIWQSCVFGEGNFGGGSGDKSSTPRGQPPLVVLGGRQLL